MKKTPFVTLLGFALSLAVAAAVAAAPLSPADFAASLAAPAVAAGCTAPPTGGSGAAFTAAGNGSSLVTCTASCGSFGSVSCSTSGTCTAYDRNCPTEVGHVVCGSTTKSCPACECTNGATRNVPTGECCDDGSGRSIKEHQECVNGVWETQYTFCGPPFICPRFP